MPSANGELIAFPEVETPPETNPKSDSSSRPEVRGKFLFTGSEKYWVKGVTYGAFRPDENKREYHDLDQIDRDFAQMAESGFNTVRIPHTTPPRELLDIAQRYKLKVMVGLSAEQYIGYLIDTRKKAPDIEGIVKEKVRTIAGHPALLCYALGNEIPASVVRWISRKRVERYLKSIYKVIKSVDPHGLVTYVNYPTTEFLQLPFLDFVSFNVYLEEPQALRNYLARLQNIAGERPLLMSEVGLDAQRNGESRQAEVLAWQIRTSFESGCIGVVTFSWTDEWFRGGAEVDDWKFGLTDRQRRPKPALFSVSEAFADAPFPSNMEAPMFTVAVCSYNGSRTIRQSLEGLQKLEYPNFEVIVVNDGSTDETEKIISQFPEFRLISTPNQGLSAARNVALREAKGDYIVYIDDDAWSDPHWLHYYATAFQSSSHVGIGGPNLAPLDSGFAETCVSGSPGGPQHVLLTDELAEHIPGCNMAFRKKNLAEIGGFDRTFRVAGDDVDVCWRIQQQGWTIGYHAAAMVWHRRRDSIKAYLKQQFGYGKAESLLETQWPEKYNFFGHVTWSGRVYGNGRSIIPGRRSRVYHGEWGSAPFQPMLESAPPRWLCYAAMPEWWLVIAGLLVISVFGYFWAPMLLALPFALAAFSLVILQAAISVMHVRFPGASDQPFRKSKLWATTFALHLLQPIERLRGRNHNGPLTRHRRMCKRYGLPRPRKLAYFTERWIDPLERLRQLDLKLAEIKLPYQRGGDFDVWDFQVYRGSTGGARLQMAIEDQGSGTQYVRIRTWPVLSHTILFPTGILLLGMLAAFSFAWIPAAFFTLSGMIALMLVLGEAASALQDLINAIETSQPDIANKETGLREAEPRKRLRPKRRNRNLSHND